MHPCTKQSDSVQIRTKIFLRTELLNAPYQSLLRPKEKENRINCSRHVLPTPSTLEKISGERLYGWIEIVTTVYYRFLHVVRCCWSNWRKFLSACQGGRCSPSLDMSGMHTVHCKGYVCVCGAFVRLYGCLIDLHFAQYPTSTATSVWVAANAHTVHRTSFLYLSKALFWSGLTYEPMCMGYYVHCMQALFIIGRIIVNRVVGVGLSIRHAHMGQLSSSSSMLSLYFEVAITQ